MSSRENGPPRANVRRFGIFSFRSPAHEPSSGTEKRVTRERANPASQREHQVNRLIAEYLEAQRLGQVSDREELVRRHPDLADELKSFFADQDRFGRVAEGIGPPAAPAAASEEAPTIAPDEVARTGPVLGTMRCFGDYELLEELRGEGWASSTRPGRSASTASWP